MKHVGAFLLILAVVFGSALITGLFLRPVINYTFAPTFLLAVFGGPLDFWKAFWVGALVTWVGSQFYTSNTSK